jgi:hypothetical protein
MIIDTTGGTTLTDSEDSIRYDVVNIYYFEVPDQYDWKVYSANNGTLKPPHGIAARQNPTYKTANGDTAIDVYVATYDEVIKYRYYPDDDMGATNYENNAEVKEIARFCNINGYSGSGNGNGLSDVEVYAVKHYPFTDVPYYRNETAYYPGYMSEVWVFITDKENHKVYIYRDEHASDPSQPESFTLLKTIGNGASTELGEFYEPTSISVVVGEPTDTASGGFYPRDWLPEQESLVDIYVADQGRFQKFDAALCGNQEIPTANWVNFNNNGFLYDTADYPHSITWGNDTGTQYEWVRREEDTLGIGYYKTRATTKVALFWAHNTLDTTGVYNVNDPLNDGYIPNDTTNLTWSYKIKYYPEWIFDPNVTTAQSVQLNQYPGMENNGIVTYGFIGWDTDGYYKWKNVSSSPGIERSTNYRVVAIPYPLVYEKYFHPTETGPCGCLVYDISDRHFRIESVPSTERIVGLADIVEWDWNGKNENNPNYVDNVLYGTNNGEGTIVLYIANFDTISALSAYLTWDNAAAMDIKGIERGEIWSTVNPNEVVFEPNWDNTQGFARIDFALTSTNRYITPYSEFGAAPAAAAYIHVSFPSNAVSLNSATNFNITLDTSKTQIFHNETRYTNEGFYTISKKPDMYGRLAYIPDIATNTGVKENQVTYLYALINNKDYPNSDTLLRYQPKPDGLVDFYDILWYAMGWNGNGVFQDAISDFVSDVEGIVIPNYIYQPDGTWTNEDNVAFTNNYSYFNQTVGKVSLGKAENIGAEFISFDRKLNNGTLNYSINGNDMKDVTAMRFVINYEHGKFALSDVTRGKVINEDGNCIYMVREAEYGTEIILARLNKEHPGINIDGELFELEFTQMTANPGGLSISYEVFDKNAEVVSKGVTSVDDLSIPESFKLEQNYPNPFNPTTQINYAIPARSMVSLKIFNTLGQEVQTLVNEIQKPGYYEMKWNGLNNHSQNAAAGVYFYQLKAGDFTQTKKMILVK